MSYGGGVLAVVGAGGIPDQLKQNLRVGPGRQDLIFSKGPQGDSAVHLGCRH